MKCVAFIPIKLNNERTPQKNIKRVFGGNSILELIQKSLLKVKGIDEIFVFCSNSIVKDYLVENVTFLKRPEYLDTKEATPNDIISEFIKLVDADVYMVCHATSPFVTTEHFEECLNAVTTSDFDSSFTAERIQKLLWTNEIKPLNFNPQIVPRTQDLPPIYSEISACYAFRKETYNKYNRRIGVNPHLTIVSGIECIDIDYPEDLLIAQAVYNNIIQITEEDSN